MKLVTNPNAFFEDLKQKDTRIKITLLRIVFPLAVLISAYQYLLVTKISDVFPEDLAKFFAVGAYIGIIGVYQVWSSMKLMYDSNFSLHTI